METAEQPEQGDVNVDIHQDAPAAPEPSPESAPADGDDGGDQD